jgi:hypothetical protein
MPLRPLVKVLFHYYCDLLLSKEGVHGVQSGGNWYAFAPTAIRMRLSSRKQRWASESPIRSPVLADLGPSSSRYVVCKFADSLHSRQRRLAQEGLRSLSVYPAQTIPFHACLRNGPSFRKVKWCGYCDYLPVCMGDKEKIKEALVQTK